MTERLLYFLAATFYAHRLPLWYVREKGGMRLEIRLYDLGDPQ